MVLSLLDLTRSSLRCSNAVLDVVCIPLSSAVGVVVDWARDAALNPNAAKLTENRQLAGGFSWKGSPLTAPKRRE